MGLDATVIGIGPYSEDIIKHLPYGNREYRGTSVGVTVVNSCVLEALGSTQSKELASLLGIDAWNFNDHELDLSKVNWSGLVSYDDFGAESLKVLAEHEFKFYFCPNG